MRKYLFLIVSLVMFACTDQLMVDEMAGEYLEMAPASEISGLIEKARWGDGLAYVKLADCYRDGKGVQQDFVGMLSMTAMACQYGGINHVEDYLNSLPKGSEYRLAIEVLYKCDKEKMQEAEALADRMVEQGALDGYTMKGIMAMERGDSLEGKRLIEQGAENGSSLAEMLLCFPNWRDCNKPDMKKLTALAERIPWVCNLLGDICSNKENVDLMNERLAAYYYMKADEQACLTKRGAQYLLIYHQTDKDFSLSESDFERIKKLGGDNPIVQEYLQSDDSDFDYDDYDSIEVVDTVVVQ